MMRYDAFFISPKGEIKEVPIRHIVAIVKEPKFFGLTIEYVKTVFKKHNEEVGWEGYARNEIILDLLKDDWIRLRFFAKSGTWRLQIHEELNDNLQSNILKFCQEIKKGEITNSMHRTADPQIEIHNTKENSLFKGSLDESIEFLKN